MAASLLIACFKGGTLSLRTGELKTISNLHERITEGI